MARVWIGEHESQSVAVKVARSGPEYAEVLRRESALLQSIRHPGVVSVLAQGIHEGRPWYAMPLLEPQQGVASDSTYDLEADPPKPRLPRDVLSLRTLRLLCGTLAWLHARGIVHRDMKPGNVLIQSDGTPVLGDFGIAVHLHDLERREAVPAGESIQGTRGYASPEQRQGKALDGRSDLYAIGRMLQELDDPRVADLATQLLAEEPADRPPYAGMVGKLLEELGGGPLPEGWPSESPRLFRAPLTGRHETLERAHAFIAAVERGEGRSVLLTGPLGAGKTRLLREVIRRTRQGRLDIITADCSTHVGAPLQGFVPLVQRLADLSQTRPGLKALVEATLAELAPIVPTLRAHHQSVEPPSREAVRDGVLHLLSTFAAERPFVLVVDDAHRADELTNLILDVILPDPIPGVGLIVSARSEELTDDLRRWQRQATSWEVPLLLPDDILEMARAMTAGSEIPDDIAAALVTSCAGSPLLATILLDEAEAAGDLTWDGDSWVWSDTAALRDSARGLAVLDRRIERLSPTAREILDTAAVLGQRFSLDTLARITHSDIAEGLLELRARHIAEPLNSESYQFTHDRLLGAAYDSIATNRREELHLMAAEALEGSATARELGHHFLRGGRPYEAVPHLRKAAEQALAQGLFRLTEELVETLVQLEGGAWFASLSRPEQAALLTLKARAVHAEGRSAAGLDIANLALPLLGVEPPTSTAGWSWVLCRELLRQVRHRWLGASPQPNDANTAFLIHLHWHHYLFNPEPLPFLATLFWAVNLAERCGDGAISGRVGGTLGLVYGMAGRAAWSDAAFARAEAWAEANGSLEGQAACLAQRAFLRIYQARWDEARTFVDQTMAVSEASQSDERMEYALFERYLLMSNIGEMEESRRMVQALMELRKRQQRRHLAAVQEICGAEQALHDGDLEQAEALIARAHRDLAGATERVQHANVWALEARLASLRGDWEAAHHACEQTVALLGTQSGRDIASTLVQRHVPEVRIALLATDVAGRPALLASAHDALSQMEVYCRSVAITRPSLARAKALLAVAEGSSEADSLLDHAITTARSMHMPFELAASLAAAASHRMDGSLAAEARSLFLSLGAAPHAERVRPES